MVMRPEEFLENSKKIARVAEATANYYANRTREQIMEDEFRECEVRKAITLMAVRDRVLGLVRSYIG
jgi:hypothetical protein